MLASLDVPSIEARDILQNFETSLSRYFSQTPLNNMRYLLMRGVQFKLRELDKLPLLSSETFWNN